MIVSSRTPEGVPNRCPRCGAFVSVEPSVPAGDAPCPHCGQLLWFIQLDDGARFYSCEDKASEPWQQADAVIQMLCEHLGVSRDHLEFDTSFREEIRADSLDLVELVMELEAGFDITIPPEEMERIQTIGDLLDYLERKRREE